MVNVGTCIEYIEYLGGTLKFPDPFFYSKRLCNFEGFPCLTINERHGVSSPPQVLPPRMWNARGFHMSRWSCGIKIHKFPKFFLFIGGKEKHYQVILCDFFLSPFFKVTIRHWNGSLNKPSGNKVTAWITWYLFTPWKFNIAPEKWWLEDYFPIGKVTFQGLC